MMISTTALLFTISYAINLILIILALFATLIFGLYEGNSSHMTSTSRSIHSIQESDIQKSLRDATANNPVVFEENITTLFDKLINTNGYIWPISVLYVDYFT